MGTEIERRWLLPALPGTPGKLLARRTRHIAQGYLERSDPRMSMRVRIVDDAAAVITAKSGSGMERTEEECAIPLDAARILMARSDHRLEKTRYDVGNWEVDVFHGPLEGVVLAEFESTDRAAVLTAAPEPWMGPGAVEVTESLTNLHLARVATDLGTTTLPTTFPLMKVPSLNVWRVKRLVITGGPGSGKSTLLGILRTAYPDLMFVPEVATILISQVGIRPGDDAMSVRKFQQAVYRTQRIFEYTSREFASLGGKRAIVMDRGTLDNAAYLPGGAREFVSLVNSAVQSEFDNYDAVISLAVPPREIYDRIRGNNSARSESFEEAVRLGNLISLAWELHPHFTAVGNHDGWDGKVAAVRRILDGLLAQ